MCFLCDFESIKNWKISEKIITLNYEVCEYLVDKTYD